MKKYVLEADLSDGCWDCPCEGEGCCCQAADYRIIMPEDAGELPDDYIPDWCPLLPLDEMFRIDKKISEHFGISLELLHSPEFVSGRDVECS